MVKCSRGCSGRLRTGDLKHKISIKRESLQPSGLGERGTAGADHVYYDLLEVWAKIETIVGRAEYARVEVGGKHVTHKFWIRAVSEPLDIRDVVEYNGARFSILAIEDMNEMGQVLVLQCRFRERI